MTILADSAIRADDIDATAAEEARRAAESLFENQTGEFDYSIASAEFAEASAQLLTLQKLEIVQTL